MNILIDLLPNAVEIDGIEYDVNSDFRTSILFELMMLDNNMGDRQKILNALELYYPTMPSNVDGAIKAMMWFYRGGKDIVESKGNGKGKITRIYSFEYDDDDIYSAFLDQYRVDLQDVEYLHWWKFKAMFKALKEDNMIVKIMGYRSMDLSKIRDKDQKEHYKKMKNLYKIPISISKSEREKLSDIENALLNGGNVSKIL